MIILLNFIYFKENCMAKSENIHKFYDGGPYILLQ